MKNRIAIYTAIYGDTDTLIEPKVIPDNCDFYCFTDRKDIVSDTWKIVHKKAKYPNDTNRSAKYFKMFPHELFKDYKYSLWMDARTFVKDKNLFKTTEKLLKENNLAIFKHPERKSVFAEAKICIEWKKDKPMVIRKQINKYKKEGYKEKNNLMMATFIFRRHHSKDVVDFEKCWWNEILENSKRDQLSFPYCAWKKNLQYEVINKNIYENYLFKIYSYKQRDELKEILNGKKKIVIYTFTNTDNLKMQESQKDYYDYVVFTSNEQLRGEKTFKYLRKNDLYEVQLKQELKILPHKYLPEYEYSIWLESGVKIKIKDIVGFILETLQNNHIALFQRVEDEMGKGDSINNIIARKQLNAYLKDGYEDNTYYDTSVIVRRHASKKIHKLSNFWFEQVKSFETDETLSLPYSLWRAKAIPHVIPGSIYDNKYFDLKNNDNILTSDSFVKRLTEITKFILWYLKVFLKKIKKKLK